ncbi:hypothetical protein QFC20_007738 [Naganishia adeliensis]|uniref:Uncharacterized protein n=1 Tax=Naganishia adeliensis TaxID=92952 RepID=A0ACC2UVM0_9TREE|nr:hypothetical protein QFC20_007738 [Naganishia adeliensis]
MTSGFIVLSHDLYQQTVDLAVGYMIPQALDEGKWKLKSVSNCLGMSTSTRAAQSGAASAAASAAPTSGALGLHGIAATGVFALVGVAGTMLLL